MNLLETLRLVSNFEHAVTSIEQVKPIAEIKLPVK